MTNADKIYKETSRAYMLKRVANDLRTRGFQRWPVQKRVAYDMWRSDLQVAQ